MEIHDIKIWINLNVWYTHILDIISVFIWLACMHFIISVNCTSKRQHSFCYTNLCLNRLLFLFYIGIFYWREENNKWTHRGLQNCRHSTMSVCLFAPSSSRTGRNFVVQKWSLTEMSLKCTCNSVDWMVAEVRQISTLPSQFSHHSEIIQSPFSQLKVEISSCEIRADVTIYSI